MKDFILVFIVAFIMILIRPIPDVLQDVAMSPGVKTFLGFCIAYACVSVTLNVISIGIKLIKELNDLKPDAIKNAGY